MTLDTVETRVREDIDLQINELRRNGAARVATIDEETRKAVTNLMQRSLAETEHILERMQTREKLSTQLTVKKILLNARRESIHDTFMTAARDLRENPERYPQLLRRQIRAATASIDISIVRADPAETTLLETILTEERINAGIIPDMHVHGGFIAETERARVCFDASIKTIFEEVAHECLKDVANILWPTTTNAMLNPTTQEIQISNQESPNESSEPLTEAHP